ncbi:MAG: hypothetical protein ACREBU_05010 [Nitrososphaera sp.]
MSWRQIRSSGGLTDVIKAMIEEQQRQQAESGVEDINDLEQARVDFDGIAYTDSHTATLNGTESDSDAIAYTDNHDGIVRNRIFRLCGGDSTTFTIAGAPAGAKHKSGDGYVGDGNFGNTECAIVGHCVMGGP